MAANDSKKAPPVQASWLHGPHAEIALGLAADGHKGIGAGMIAQLKAGPAALAQEVASKPPAPGAAKPKMPGHGGPASPMATMTNGPPPPKEH